MSDLLREEIHVSFLEILSLNFQQVRQIDVNLVITSHLADMDIVCELIN